MHATPRQGEDIVRTGEQSSDDDRNDRRLRLAWAAGFIDGEGNIGIYRNGAGRNSQSLILVLQAVQVNPAPLLELQALFGGAVHPRSGHGKRRDYYGWVLNAQRAHAAIVEIAPYILMKKREVEIALEFQATQRPRQGTPLTEKQLAEKMILRDELMALHRQSWG